jgi:hypothetical protein
VLLATDGTGSISMTNGSRGTVQLVLDVSGYFESLPAPPYGPGDGTH